MSNSAKVLGGVHQAQDIPAWLVWIMLLMVSYVLSSNLLAFA